MLNLSFSHVNKCGFLGVVNNDFLTSKIQIELQNQFSLSKIRHFIAINEEQAVLRTS